MKIKKEVTIEVEINLPYYCQSNDFAFVTKIISDTEYIHLIKTKTHIGYDHDFGDVMVEHFYSSYTQCTEQDFKDALDKFKNLVLVNEVIDVVTDEIPMFKGTMDELDNLKTTTNELQK